jgi:hypothetical protein
VAISACQNEKAVLAKLESLILHYGTWEAYYPETLKNICLWWIEAWIYCQFCWGRYLVKAGLSVLSSFPICSNRKSFLERFRHRGLIMRKKDLLKLTLACWLALIGWVNPGWAADVADRCQQLCKNGQYEQAFPVCSMPQVMFCKWIILFIICVLLFPAIAFSGRIYSWTDENGVTHFSDTPADENGVVHLSDTQTEFTCESAVKARREQAHNDKMRELESDLKRKESELSNIANRRLPRNLNALQTRAIRIAEKKGEVNRAKAAIERELRSYNPGKTNSQSVYDNKIKKLQRQFDDLEFEMRQEKWERIRKDVLE